MSRRTKYDGSKRTADLSEQGRRFLFLTEGAEMKKQYKAIETEPGKWKKKTGWKLNKSDLVGLVIFAAIIFYIAIHVIIGGGL
jgi:hypothetical protein